MTKIDVDFYKHRILMQEGNYSIVQFEGLPAETKLFLKEIKWGSEGAVYQNMDTEKIFDSIPDPFLVAILEDGLILATGVFCRTKVSLKNKEYPCYYIRFFAASPAIKGKGIMKNYSSQIMQLIGNETKENTIYFANVEKGNRASYQVVHGSGYEPLFMFNTLGFSRFFPSECSIAEKVESEQDEREVEALLREFYKGYSFVHFDSLFRENNYHIIRHNGRIVAGCQYYRVHWVIRKMPGWSGKVIMWLLPKLPLIKRIFNPKKFEFIAFDSIYVRSGHEQELSQLFEHLLAVENVHSALLWLGSTSTLKSDIQTKIKLGILNKFVSDSSVFCMVRTENFSDEDFINLKECPVYAPAFDFI